MKLLRILDQYGVLPDSYARQLRDLLAERADCLEHPKLRRSVALTDVPRWDSLGRSFDRPQRMGTLLHWRAHQKSYSATFTHLPQLANLVTLAQGDSAVVDIRRIEGLGSSKSNLHEHDCLDRWAETYARWAIEDQTPEAIDRLLRSRGSEAAGDTLVVHDYDERVFLGNSGGSHRFTAARYIAGKLDLRVPVEASIQRYHVDEEAVTDLQREFCVFSHRGDAAFSNELFDLLKAGLVPHYVCDMPLRMGGAPRSLGGDGTGYRAILLPKEVPSARKVIAVFEQAGAMEVLSELQRQCLARNRPPLDLGNPHSSDLRP